MSEEAKSCAKCGQQVTEINGALVHIGGGAMMQKCQHCGWQGSQIGRFSQCPQCGESSYLLDDHIAS